MSFKKLILILTITVSILIISLLGVSYAWYGLTEASTNFEVMTDNTDLTVVHAQSSAVLVTAGAPIAEADAPTKAGISRFTVTPGNNLTGYNVQMAIDLSQIKIDSQLKTADFKIQLYENGTLIFNGDGTDVTSDTLNLKPMTSVTIGNTYSYELRIWIKETNVSQNALMGKSFSGQIKISNMMKK